MLVTASSKLYYGNMYSKKTLQLMLSVAPQEVIFHGPIKG